MFVWFAVFAIFATFCFMGILFMKPLATLLRSVRCDLAARVEGGVPYAVSCPQCGHSRIRVTTKRGGGHTFTCLTCLYEWDAKD